MAMEPRELKQGPKPLRERLPLPERNQLQGRLMEEFRMDPLAWVDKYAAMFNDITTNSKKLRALIERDPEAAVKVVQHRLEAEVPPPVRDLRRPLER